MATAAAPDPPERPGARPGRLEQLGGGGPALGDHAGPRSLRHLLQAVLSIASDLDLHRVLRRIVEAAVDLVDARYGALGVLDDERLGLADFITVGIDEETHRTIGSLPKGRGLLGVLITDARPLRLADLSEHPGRAGFPAGHPHMTSFLGVPIVVRGQVFGNLYLTDKRGGEVFTDIDEELAVGLAAAAAVAIDNARLYGEVRRREAELGAMHEVATLLLAGARPEESLRAVARHARAMADADLATVALPSADGATMAMEVVEGALGSDVEGVRFRTDTSISGEVLRSGQAVVVEDLSADGRSQQPQVAAGTLGPALFVGLVADGGTFGTLAVARQRGRPAFSPAEQALVSSFAAQASLALALEQGRQRVARLALLEDQERIARDLHDSVIQRLFATGLALQAVTRLVPDPAARARIDAAVDDLDVTVRHIRTAIFDVHSSHRADPDGLRTQVLDLLREAGRTLGFEPRVSFDGPVDTVVAPDVGRELLGTLREALSNVVRHAHATAVSVEVAVGEHLELRVHDDGIGIAPSDQRATGGKGLANMRARAELLGGTCTTGPGRGGGTVVTWTVPQSPI